METGKKAVKRFGKRLKQLRQSKRWTQEHLAAALSVEQSYISGIERGLYGPSFQRLARLAEIFEISVSELCNDI